MTPNQKVRSHFYLFTKLNHLFNICLLGDVTVKHFNVLDVVSPYCIKPTGSNEVEDGVSKFM